MSELNKNDLKTSLSTTNSTGKTILKSDYPELAAAVCEPKIDVEMQKYLESENKTIKIHFELSEEDYNRLKRYIPNNRIRHEIARLALLEMINRKEGRDKKLQAEKLIKDAAYIQKMIDQGLIKISEDKDQSKNNSHYPHTGGSGGSMPGSDW